MVINKQAYYRGLTKKAAFNIKTWLKQTPTWKTGIPVALLGGGLGGYAGYQIGDKWLRPFYEDMWDMHKNSKHALQQARKIADMQPSEWWRKRRDSLDKDFAEVKNKLMQGWDMNTLGKYVLGGTGIIGGAILLNGLIDRINKKKKDKEQEQEQEQTDE